LLACSVGINVDRVQRVKKIVIPMNRP